jgi:hypothetical protein
MNGEMVLYKLDTVKKIGVDWVRANILSTQCTMTKPGSLTHLLFGEKQSEQSINIKVGRLGETLAKTIIGSNPQLELMQCGVQVIDDAKKKKKDIDLIWADHSMNTIYVREAKGNIELDTEKLPATFTKITEELLPFVKSKYPEYTVNVGILNWSVYSRNELIKGQSHIKKCEMNGVCVNHWSDFCMLTNFAWDRDDYYEYMRDIGKMIETRGGSGFGSTSSDSEKLRQSQSQQSQEAELDPSIILDDQVLGVDLVTDPAAV